MRREALDAFPLEEDVAFLRRVEAADHVEGRCLARPVGADETGDGALGQPHGQIVDGGDAAKAHGDVLDIQQQFGVLGKGGHARFLRVKKLMRASQVISRIPIIPSRR